MDTVVHAVAAYVKQLFAEYEKNELAYHNFAHTLNVVRRSNEMTTHYGLSGENRRVVLVAAWFHDSGYLVSGAYEHEKASVEIMKQFLAPTDIISKTVEQVAGCIMATKIPPNPQNLLEEIVCDADTYHLGTHEFLMSNETVKREFQQAKQVTDEEWNKMTLDFLEHHLFYTDYCKQRLNQGKLVNIKMLRGWIDLVRNMNNNP
jgi:predicted metal-dependent HD superfamily phosphohydrolase